MTLNAERVQHASLVKQTCMLVVWRTNRHWDSFFLMNTSVFPCQCHSTSAQYSPIYQKMLRKLST